MDKIKIDFKIENYEKLCELLNNKYEGKVSGVYKIENNINKKVYIGETLNIKRRFCEHLDELNNDAHVNYKLQKDWNSNISEFFSFEVLEYTTNLSDNETTVKAIGLIYENNYINKFNSIINGYNIEYTLSEIKSGKKDFWGRKCYNRNCIGILKSVLNIFNDNNGIYVKQKIGLEKIAELIMRFLNDYDKINIPIREVFGKPTLKKVFGIAYDKEIDKNDLNIILEAIQKDYTKAKSANGKKITFLRKLYKNK